MMLGQETDVLITEPFVHLIMLDTTQEGRLVVVPFAANYVSANYE